jgi:4-hydroxysphinganine ceramide fatty acyl 2-hydroxylase
LKQHHLRHHYHDDHLGYGVSSPLWDYIFGTNRK